MVGERESGEGRGPEGDQRTYVTAEIDFDKRKTDCFSFLEKRVYERPTRSSEKEKGRWDAASRGLLQRGFRDGDGWSKGD